MQKGELREQRFHTGTVELNDAEGPASGEALLYLHGGNSRWQEGRALLEELASAFQVYGLDLRGHGLSGRVPGAYRLQDYASDVATFLEQVVNRPTVVIGHSMGGHVGIMLAARSPHLVRALIVEILRRCQGMSSQRMLAPSRMRSDSLMNRAVPALLTRRVRRHGRRDRQGMSPLWARALGWATRKRCLACGQSTWSIWTRRSSPPSSILDGSIRATMRTCSCRRSAVRCCSSRLILRRVV